MACLRKQLAHHGWPACLNCVPPMYFLILQLSLWGVEVSMMEDLGDGYADNISSV